MNTMFDNIYAVEVRNFLYRAPININKKSVINMYKADVKKIKYRKSYLLFRTVLKLLGHKSGTVNLSVLFTTPDRIDCRLMPL